MSFRDIIEMVGSVFGWLVWEEGKLSWREKENGGRSERQTKR